MMNTESFFEDLYKDALQSHHTKRKDTEWRTTLKSQLNEKLGRFSKQRVKVEANLVEKIEFEEYTREILEFQSVGGLILNVYVLTPKNQPYEKIPSVLALHGHGYGVKEIVGLLPDGRIDNGEPGIHQHFAVNLVKKGLKVFAPEIIGFGERLLDHDIATGKQCSCYSMSTHLLMAGKTLAGLRVFEAQLLIDRMTTFDDVDQKKIGVMGFSGGGLIAAYTAALDDRIKATVLCSFTNTFKGSILAMEHCIDNYVPGILKLAELPEIISLISPRKLFVESGTKDPIFPVEHTKEAIAFLENTYVQLGSPENFSSDLFEGVHEVSGKVSYDWLKSSLS